MPERLSSRQHSAFGRLVLALVAILVLALPASATGLRTIDLLAGKTRPDKPGMAFDLFMTPVIYQDTVAFLTRFDGVVDGLWSIDITTREIKRLVSLSHLVPGGKGRFTCLCQRDASDDVTPTIGPGRIVFYGIDEGNSIGIYQVPIGGGAIRRVVDSDMRSSDGTKFVRFGRASIGIRRIVFRGQTETHEGIYALHDDKPEIIRLIDDRTRLDARRKDGGITPGYYSNYDNPVIGLTQVYYTARGSADPGTGANAVFRFGRFLVADHLNTIGGKPDQHVRMLGLSSAANSSTVAIKADQPSTGYVGLLVQRYGRVSSVVSTRNGLAGVGKYQSFGAFSFDDSGLAFMATARGVMVIGFTPPPYAAVYVFARGDRSFDKPTLGERSVSRGRVVFTEDGGARRLLLAVPNTNRAWKQENGPAQSDR